MALKLMALKAVVFDVGETLVDETRMWEEWADRLGVPHLTFLATLGGVIARGEDHRRVFELVRPNYDVDRALREGVGNGFRPADLYDDALPCIERLRADGYRVGLAGNQPEETARTLDGLGVRRTSSGRRPPGARGNHRRSSSFASRRRPAASRARWRTSAIGSTT